jgi:hypothetical protein
MAASLCTFTLSMKTDQKPLNILTLYPLGIEDATPATQFMHLTDKSADFCQCHLDLDLGASFVRLSEY